MGELKGCNIKRNNRWDFSSNQTNVIEEGLYVYSFITNNA